MELQGDLRRWVYTQIRSLELHGLKNGPYPLRSVSLTVVSGCSSAYLRLTKRPVIADRHQERIFRMMLMVLVLLLKE